MTTNHRLLNFLKIKILNCGGVLKNIWAPSLFTFCSFPVGPAYPSAVLIGLFAYNMVATVSQIDYSDKYYCKNYEYRHVMLPLDVAKKVPRTHLMTETEWRNLGVQQSPGWMHFMIHNPEPHILLFRRPRTDINGNPEAPPPDIVSAISNK